MGIPWLICYGTNDDLVEKETALAPLDYINAEVTPFPKGHVAMATSWSDPGSDCALHTRFGEGNWRGPVRFQMDLDRNSSESIRQKAPKKVITKQKAPQKAVKKQKTSNTEPDQVQRCSPNRCGKTLYRNAGKASATIHWPHGKREQSV